MNILPIAVNWSEFCQIFELSMAFLVAIAIYGVILYVLMVLAEEHPFLGIALIAFWFIVPFAIIALFYSIS